MTPTRAPLALLLTLALHACADPHPLAQAYWQAPYDPARAQAYAHALEQQGHPHTAALIRQRAEQVQGHGQAIATEKPQAGEAAALPGVWR